MSLGEPQPVRPSAQKPKFYDAATIQQHHVVDGSRPPTVLSHKGIYTPIKNDEADSKPPDPPSAQGPPFPWRILPSLLLYSFPISVFWGIAKLTSTGIPELAMSRLSAKGFFFKHVEFEYL